MPLTEEQSACLNAIQGPNGIMSTIGNRIKGYNVDTIHYDPDQHSLDVLSRVFFKAAGAAPYVALIDVQGSQNMYVSFPGTGQHHNALMQAQVINLRELLANYNTLPEAQFKFKLFKMMYENKNDILAKYLQDFVNAQDIIDYSGEVSYIQEARLLANFQTIKGKETRKAFNEFILQKFDTILPDIQAIAGTYSQRSFVVVYGSINHSVHVETGGTFYAKQINPDAKIFNIGLANKTHPEIVGCCTGCAAEFNAFHKVHVDYEFHRTSDFPKNFPIKTYKVSGLSSSENAVFVGFTREIRDRCNSVIDDRPQLQIPDITNHDFFTDANLVAPIEVLGEVA